MRLIIILTFSLFYLWGYTQHTNIQVDNPGSVSSPNEPSIMFNPSNPSQLIAGANLDYYYISEDGGETFTNFKISESPFSPNSGIFFGDYTNIVAHDNMIRPIWTRLNDNELSIMTAIVDITAVGLEQPASPIAIQSAYPNPFSSSINLSFELKEKSKVKISLFSLNGKKITSLTNRIYPVGEYVEHFKGDFSELTTGMYYLKLITNQHVSVKKVMYKR